MGQCLCRTVLQRRRPGGLPASKQTIERGHDSTVPAATGGGDARHPRQGHRTSRPQAPEHSAHAQRSASPHATPR